MNGPTLEQSEQILLAQEEAFLAELEARRFQEELAIKEAGVQQEKEKKETIGWLAFAFGLFVAGITDLFEIILTLFGVTIPLAWLASLAGDGILLLTFGVSKAGRKQLKSWLLGLLGADTIPLINVLPLRTIFVIALFIKSRT